MCGCSPAVDPIQQQPAAVYLSVHSQLDVQKLLVLEDLLVEAHLGCFDGGLQTPVCRSDNQPQTELNWARGAAPGSPSTGGAGEEEQTG